MDFSSPHTGFVIAAYGLSLAVLAGLAARILIRDRMLRAEAARLNAGQRDRAA